MTAESPERTGARQHILAAIDAHDDGDNGARIDVVVDAALDESATNPTGVLESFIRLFRSGEVYECEPAHVARTSGRRSDTSTDTGANE
jgi:hypothetical protein